MRTHALVGVGAALFVLVSKYGFSDIDGVPAVAVTLEVQGQPVIDPLTVALNDLGGVLEVTAKDLAQPAD